MAARAFFYLNLLVFVGIVAGVIATLPFGVGDVVVVQVPLVAPDRDSAAVPTESQAGVEPSGVWIGVESALGNDLHPQHLRAREAFRSGRTARGISLLEELRRYRPKDAVVINDLGVYYASIGEHDAALSAFADALAIDPEYARAHYNRGTVFVAQEDLAAAETAFTSALDAKPFYGEARYNRALVRTRSGDLAGAIRDYLELIKTDRSDTGVKANYNLGVLRARQGRWSDAIKVFRAALYIQPDHQAARFNMALVLAKSGSPTEARREYQKLLQLEPGHRNAALNLSAMFMKDERWEDAATLLDDAASRHPQDAAFPYNLGLCRVRLGDDLAAVTSFERAAGIDSEYAEAFYNLGLARLRIEDAEASVAAFARAVVLRPSDPTYHYNLALAQTAAGRLDEAVKAYEGAVQQDPEYFRAWYNVATLEYRRGNYSAALSAFGRALEIRPDSYNATYNRGLALLKLDRAAEAGASLRSALGFSETVEAHYSLGLALSRQGRLDAALESYRAALTLNPKHARSIERLGETLSELGRHDEALSRFILLQKLDEADPSAFNAGLGLFRSGEFEVALGYFDVAARASGLRRKALNMKATTQMRLDRVDGAVSTYRLALDDFPGNPVLLRNLARAFAQAREHRRALEVLEALAPEDLDSALSQVVLAQQYLALGDDTAAELGFRRALELDPSSESATAGLASLAELVATEPGAADIDKPSQVEAEGEQRVPTASDGEPAPRAEAQ